MYAYIHLYIYIYIYTHIYSHVFMKTNDFKYSGPSQKIVLGLENNQILELTAITFKA